MDILIIVILLAAAIVLFLVEVFIIPGVSVAGIAAALCLVYANFHAFVHLGVAGGIVTLIVSAVAAAGSFVWFMRSKTLDKVALKENISSTVQSEAKSRVKPGDTGIAVTRLALIGTALIDGETVEVKSADGFLDEKTPIRVARVSEGVIMVERNNS
ncbi:MAG: nodulation efficiency protein D (NfeD) [Prevotellaceae bacterium]|nr:nodulation efficiency protein D (NfeD) [Prevotellaceae bacterium]